MKKLMIAAAAVAMVGAANAAKVGYVYDVKMDITTTQAELCQEKIYGECSEDSGVDVLVRVSDKYTIRGLIFACADACTHLYQELHDTNPTGYQLSGNGANGVILWDEQHEVPVFPAVEGVDYAQTAVSTNDYAWNKGKVPVIKADFVNVIGRSYDRSEMAFAFLADAAFGLEGADDKYAMHQFDMKGAGWGVFDRVEKTDKDGKLVSTEGIWTRLGGYMAGTMSAPFGINSNGNVGGIGAYALGRNCALATCNGTKNTANTKTFAVGEWAITYNEAESRAFGQNASKIKGYVPGWLGW